jgi:hypothetical protein
MNEDMAEHDDLLLRALGRVEPPRPAVLDAAREALWSAVAAEMLAEQPPGGSARSRAADPGQPRYEPRRGDEPGS